MSSKTLELDDLHLTSYLDGLKLSITSAMDIAMPMRNPKLDTDARVNALASWKLWVMRGVSCHIAFRVLIDGKELPEDRRFNFLESLGHQFCSLELWSELSLSPSLDILTKKSLNNQPDFTLRINHGIQVPELGKEPKRAWEAETDDIRPPESVLCAEFARLNIQFHFQTIGPESPQREIALFEDKVATDDVILLDSTKLHGEKYLKDLESVVETLHTLPKLIELVFELKRERTTYDSTLSNHCYNASGSGNGEIKSRQPKGILDTLIEWLDSHGAHRYPNTAETVDLMQRTGLRKNQLKTWLQNARQKCRLLSAGTDGEEMLLSNDNLDNNQDKVTTDDVEDDMLLSTTFPISNTEITSNPFNESSNNSILLSKSTLDVPCLVTQSSAMPTVSSLKQDPQDIDICKRESCLIRDGYLTQNTAACKLAAVGFRVLLAGGHGNDLQASSIEIEKPLPKLTVSRIVPNLFSWGFKRSMACNSRFLPTISFAISSSWPRNIQSPSLKEKLWRLSKCTPSRNLGEETESDVVANNNGLSAVVQARLWSMMQRELYNPSTTRNRWRENGTGTRNNAEEYFLDLFEMVEEESEMEDLLGDTDEDFDDLLINDYDDCYNDEDLLSDMHDLEKEKIDLEVEANMMLFGDGWDSNRNYDWVEEDMLLKENAEDGTDSDDMLI